MQQEDLDFQVAKEGCLRRCHIIRCWYGKQQLFMNTQGKEF